MAVILTNATVGATGTHVATGVTEVLASGSFGGGSVRITAVADGQNPAPVHVFGSPGSISVQAAAGTSLTATVVGGTGAVVDVTMNP